MKTRTKLATAVIMVSMALTVMPATAHAGLWCEQTDRVDENLSGPEGVSAGAACSSALVVVCTVAGKVNRNGGSGCLQ